MTRMVSRLTKSCALISDAAYGESVVASCWCGLARLSNRFFSLIGLGGQVGVVSGGGWRMTDARVVGESARICGLLF